MEKRTVYMDNSSTTRPFDSVVDRMSEVLRYIYGNPSSLHQMGIEAEKIVKEAGEILAGALECKPSELIFTSGGTESNNLAIKGVAEANCKKGNHMVTVSTAHSSILNTFRALEEDGFDVTYLPVDEQGYIRPEQLEEVLSEDTILVSIMHVNNETGVIQPLEKLSDVLIRQAKRPVFHVDAVQSFGKVPVKLFNSDIDLLSLSGHKIHGPKGVGALFCREGVKLRPQMHGGNQQKGIRSGTGNIAGVAGFARAVEELFKDHEEKIKELYQLRTFLEDKIHHEIPYIKFNTPKVGSAPHITNITFPGIKAEVLLHQLEAEGIYVSTSSACNSRNRKASHVLKAMGMKDEDIEGALRISLSVLNSQEDILYCIEKIIPAYKRLQKMVNL